MSSRVFMEVNVKGGRSGDSVNLHIDTVHIDDEGKATYIDDPAKRSGFIVKRYSDTRRAGLELKLARGSEPYTRSGYFSIPQVFSPRQLNEAGLELFQNWGYYLSDPRELDHYVIMNFIEDPTFFETIFFDPRLNDVGALYHKFNEMYARALTVRNITSVVLDDNDKRFIIDDEKEKLIAKGATLEEAELTPFSTKIRNQGLTDPLILEMLKDIEMLSRPFKDRFSAYDMDTAGRNWAGTTKIDLGGVKFDITGHSLLLDTPYLFSDDYWLNPEAMPEKKAEMEYQKNLIFFNYNMGDRMTGRTYSHNEIMQRGLSFQMGRLYRNFMQMAHAYSEAQKALEFLEKYESTGSGGKPIEMGSSVKFTTKTLFQAIYVQSVSEAAAHHHFAMAAFDSIIKNLPDYSAFELYQEVPGWIDHFNNIGKNRDAFRKRSEEMLDGIKGPMADLDSLRSQ
ncbi:MAG: hypothetical protein ABIJ08_04930, partial [Nanoarchaeota archaeon]